MANTGGDGVNEAVMAANQGANGQAEQQQEWDGEHLQEAEKTLKEMYIQLRQLRSTIPNLVASLATKQPSPEILFQQLSSAASTANSEVKQFREIMDNPQSRQLFEHARESRSKNPDGITPWRITDDPNWLKRDS
ncbi:hypothetical protein V495_07398 [Pseudogymnoascus sp. VKM F-4514 (FW-929)]|nr:hypothetical protein V490_02351 [Pseudogymnoascus sp. VKM F-3557]KFY37066.1 hypothetical protein V495_07398 [Pseudogymnoascus sp. VKM F-4514 (FW-929)]KFY56529.1 hypothetical protein V497_06172 [Pseudogymnoascus sp. VKM F-4516 (FW-969)]